MTNAPVHLIDDDEAVRRAVTFLLVSMGFMVEAYESALAFLAKLPASPDGCVLTDIRMPGMSGLELQRALNNRRVFMPVIVMTGHGDVPLAVQAMKEGAVDFIEKPFSDETLLAAVREALARQAHESAQRASHKEFQTRLDRLTPRERQVMDGLVNGLPNKSIAYDLAISARTVEIYRANLMTKMQANSLPDLVRMVLLAASSAER